jgi:thiol:disulfide interchange protein DsbA
MFRTLVSIALLSLSVAACAREQTPAPAEEASTAAANAVEEQPAAAPADSAARQAAQPENASEQATAAQESISEATEEEHKDSKLTRLAAVPADQALPDDRWKAGVNYQPLVPPQPTYASAGQVEVLEMFAYGCPHCAALEPYILSWVKTKPSFIKFEQIPAWGADEARLFYTIEALGKPELHAKVFQAIHPRPGERHYDLLFAPRDDDKSAELQKKFLGTLGVSAADFDKARKSFSMDTNLKRAEALLKRYSELYEVGTVPSVVINGKYVTDVGRAGGHTQLLQLINDLAASEKNR